MVAIYVRTTSSFFRIGTPVFNESYKHRLVSYHAANNTVFGGPGKIPFRPNRMPSEAKVKTDSRNETISEPSVSATSSMQLLPTTASHKRKYVEIERTEDLPLKLISNKNVQEEVVPNVENVEVEDEDDVQVEVEVEIEEMVEEETVENEQQVSRFVVVHTPFFTY